MSEMKMLVALQLLLYFVICSCDTKCATYYTESNNNGKTLLVTKNMVAKDNVKGGDKVFKVNVESRCLFFTDKSVYDGGDYTVNDTTSIVQCCCEFYSSDYERFLNRHQLNSINQSLKEEVKRRCIPIRNRKVNTFVTATEVQLKEICGSKNIIDCKSKNSFTLHNIQMLNNSNYIDETINITNSPIVVTCNSKLPVHFVCFNQTDQNFNNYTTC
ncbi:uncharacterized protein LOC120528060 [Polypterus senegalus]|uniref:uncharacterized protein LOC120528060 n=1 Tax=Polypterus senegalus TaxID=55291 RepID=UPI001965945C|nr:uncharacterized protein LOC120528060 [Polypterus senegalus]